MPESLPPIAILAGGLASRMRPLTETIPKSMLPVAGRPFIAHQLDLLAAQNVRDIVVCCGFLGEQIENFVGNGSRFGCHVRYSFDGPELKGTGGAIKQALPLLGEVFFVMYGDSYLPTSFARPYEQFLNSGKSALMTVYRNQGRWDTSNVEFVENGIVNYDKKNRTPQMNYIDYGLGVFRKELFDSCEFQEVFDLADVYRVALLRGELAGFEVERRFYEIGTMNGLRETDALLSAANLHKNREVTNGSSR